MKVYYVFDEYGNLIAEVTDENRAREIAEREEGYYCTDEN